MKKAAYYEAAFLLVVVLQNRLLENFEGHRQFLNAKHMQKTSKYRTYILYS